ncbi:hypothetical protein ABZX75_24445 [Streptomyces sp. NPDC003038]|uniref:hypothetical protein n=1 Tax=unclassified Streptomyces TaxID=2593676 RepID=UPI00339DE00D
MSRSPVTVGLAARLRRPAWQGALQETTAELAVEIAASIAGRHRVNLRDALRRLTGQERRMVLDAATEAAGSLT